MAKIAPTKGSHHPQRGITAAERDAVATQRGNPATEGDTTARGDSDTRGGCTDETE